MLFSAKDPENKGIHEQFLELRTKQFGPKLENKLR